MTRRAGERKKAMEAGLTRYFTGSPCSRGHIAERMVSTKACVTCKNMATTAAFKARRERIGDTTFFSETPCIRGHIGLRNASNGSCMECNRARKAAADLLNPGATARYWREHKDWARSTKARRRASKKAAMPPWVDKGAIAAVYAMAAELERGTGIPHHVDHIIPLNGKTVCGLHVPWNLQPLPWRENLAKGNKILVSA